MSLDPPLGKMKAPSDRRPSIWRGGVLQVWVTRACDRACFNCTQGSNLGGRPGAMTLDQYAAALDSLKGYWGVVGMFGGNPAVHPQFDELCKILRAKVPWEQRGLWCNNLRGKGAHARITFNPAVSNLNVHEDKDAAAEMRRDWPEAARFVKGVTGDSRHSPPFVAMKDVVRMECGRCGGDGKAHGSDRPFESSGPGTYPGPCPQCGGSGTVPNMEEIWDMVGRCDVNQFWSAMIGVFRGELRGWFCELAGAQAMLHQDEPDYPDTGLDPTAGYGAGRIGATGPLKWWQLGMDSFADQVKKHCPDCGIPLRGYGALANTGPAEQVSETHKAVYQPKRVGRKVELVVLRDQLNEGHLRKATDYIENGGFK